MLPKTYCGLDFGTSNSTIALMHQQRPFLVPLEAGKPTLPSAIFFSFEDNQTYFGRKAIEEYQAGAEGRLLRALKSILGSSLAEETTRIKTRDISLTAIIGMLLGHLKHQAEVANGAPLGHAVLGRPVYFVDNNPTADAAAQTQLEAAARAQGFGHISFQFEPIAAALDYEQQVTQEQLALIVDIGGGTADFSVVRVGPDRAKLADRKADILATNGVHLGGTDFDRLLSLAKLMPHLGYGTRTTEKGHELPTSYYYNLASWHKIPTLYNKHTLQELRQLRFEAAQPALVQNLINVLEARQGHALAAQIEASKIMLTQQPLLKLSLPLLDTEIEITAPAFNAAITEAVEKIVAAVQATLAQAGIGPARIGALFLTGGSSQIPLLKASITGLFPQAQVVEGDMFGSVGMGLALDAHRKFQ